MMHSMIMILFTMLHLIVLADSEKAFYGGLQKGVLCYLQQEVTEETFNISSMEALDMVKERYADNFIKQRINNTKEYFYQLPSYNYYLYYEGMDESEMYYMIHLYEFVIDDMDMGVGHYVTYGWYLVHKKTGEILE